MKRRIEHRDNGRPVPPIIHSVDWDKPPEPEKPKPVADDLARWN
jgi:hypothetical protein